jgi:hypothetical protein
MYHGFKNAKDVFDAFALAENERIGIHILFAQYDTDEFEGTAGIIFVKINFILWPKHMGPMMD